MINVLAFVLTSEKSKKSMPCNPTVARVSKSHFRENNPRINLNLNRVRMCQKTIWRA